MSLKSFIKGWAGELQGTLAKKLFLDEHAYIDVNNVTIPTANGTTQIDHVIVSRHGVFVIEAKNMDGWIFGSEKSPQWTQSLFGKKLKFQNPLHQNYRHTKALSEFLGIEHDKFFTIVMFWGECEFKTPMPSNVLAKGYVSYIKSHTAVLFPDPQVQEIAAAIRSGMLDKSLGRRPVGNEIVTYELTTDERRRPRAVNVAFVGERRIERSTVGSGWGPTAFVILFLAFVAGAILTGKLPIMVLGIYFGASVVAFAVYAFDKSAAEKGQWRTKERTLHLFGLIGGWPGALLAQKVFRHKSRKQEFQTVFWATVVINCGALAVYASPTASHAMLSILGAGR